MGDNGEQRREPRPWRAGLTYSEIEKACANIGFDVSCGECATLFYTGHGGFPQTKAAVFRVRDRRLVAWVGS